MARLILSLDGQVMAEYNMNKERYTVGRLPDNDIRIDNPAVSGHHSLIINILNDSFLEDLNSTNGTYVNGKLIKKHALQHGDVITAGHHQLRFVEDDDAQQDEFEKTMVIQPSQRPIEKIQTRARPSPSTGATTSRRALPDGAHQPVKKAKLQVLSGAFAGRELELVKALTTLGRPGIQVAADHAPRGWLLHRARRRRRARQLSAGQWHADRRAGAPAGRQRRDPARRREDGVLRELRAGCPLADRLVLGEDSRGHRGRSCRNPDPPAVHPAGPQSCGNPRQLPGQCRVPKCHGIRKRSWHNDNENGSC